MLSQTTYGSLADVLNRYTDLLREVFEEGASEIYQEYVRLDEANVNWL